MKADIHPKEYRPVLFVDQASGATFLIGSTIRTTETGTFEGKSYPQRTVETSSASHPFWTGKTGTLKASRVEAFKKRLIKDKSKKK